MSNNKRDVHLVQMDSESELRDYINHCGGEVFGDGIENASKYFKIELQLYSEGFTIGILNGGHGIKPQVKIVEPTLTITSDQMLYIFILKRDIQQI